MSQLSAVEIRSLCEIVMGRAMPDRDKDACAFALANCLAFRLGAAFVPDDVSAVLRAPDYASASAAVRRLLNVGAVPRSRAIEVAPKPEPVWERKPDLDPDPDPDPKPRRHHAPVPADSAPGERRYKRWSAFRFFPIPSENPYPIGSAARRSFEVLLALADEGVTFADFLQLGGRRADMIRACEAGYVREEPISRGA